MATFFAGLTIGIIVGLFIASYLVKLGKMSNKKKAGKQQQMTSLSNMAQQNNQTADSPAQKHELKSFNRQASNYTGSTKSGSNDGENDIDD